MNLALISDIVKKMTTEIRKVIIGQDEVVELLLTSLLCGGHVLIEGVPGTGKTFLVQSFAKCLNFKFGRIQFTPDMMPGDVLGTNLFNFQTNSFVLTPGPIFTHVLLADEINRTPPKTQSALLQAMNERTVTIDRQTYGLGDEFMVVATQNPIEQQGTYPLPEAQLDRFLFKIVVDYPSKEEEREIVRLHGHQSVMPKLSSYSIESVVNSIDTIEARKLVSSVTLSEDLINYIVDIVRSTRQNSAVDTGASPRAANMLAAASRSYAAICGRDFVIPDDVKRLAVPLLRHRIVMSSASEIEGITSEQIINRIISQMAAPR